MKLKLLVNALLAGALLAVLPAWAHGGHGHGKHWAKHHRHVQGHYHHYPAYRERVVIRHYWAGVPVYRPYAALPAPGVHIVTPDIYIPWPH